MFQIFFKNNTAKKLRIFFQIIITWGVLNPLNLRISAFALRQFSALDFSIFMLILRILLRSIYDNSHARSLAISTLVLWKFPSWVFENFHTRSSKVPILHLWKFSRQFAEFPCSISENFPLNLRIPALALWQFSELDFNIFMVILRKCLWFPILDFWCLPLLISGTCYAQSLNFSLMSEYSISGYSHVRRQNIRIPTLEFWKFLCSISDNTCFFLTISIFDNS